MRTTFKKLGLVTSGILIGVLISLNITALAAKLGVSELPVDDLRVFAEVFGKVKERNFCPRKKCNNTDERDVFHAFQCHTYLSPTLNLYTV